MWWVAWWVVVTVVGACGVVASVNSLRFERRVAREVHELEATLDVPVLDLQPIIGLPDPVRRYLNKAIGARQRPLRTVRLRHGGTFRPSLDGAWLPIRGQQHFSAKPPGFIWWGRVRPFPGLWIDARDRSVNGEGNMFVTMESTFTIADSRGPQLDQGALVRLLGEMTWLPTAFLDGRYVQWSAVGARRASATLQVNGRSGTAVFEFGADDLPMTFSADRFRDDGGKAILTPWVGRYSDYRPVDGVLVPHRVVAAWIIDGRALEYARFDVQQLEFDVRGPS